MVKFSAYSATRRPDPVAAVLRASHEVQVMAPGPAAGRAGGMWAGAGREGRDLPGDRGGTAGASAALFDIVDQPPRDPVHATGRARALCHDAQRAVRP